MKPNPLAGYALARTNRHGYVLTKKAEDGTTLYHSGFGEFSPDRDCAIKYPTYPNSLVTKYPGTQATLA
jgi:hypothetical protein